MTAVLTHTGDRWIDLCDECHRPLAAAPWWAPDRLEKRRRHPEGGCGAALLDDLTTYARGGESLTTAAARHGTTDEALTRRTRRVKAAYPELAGPIDRLVTLLTDRDTHHRAVARREATRPRRHR